MLKWLRKLVLQRIGKKIAERDAFDAIENVKRHGNSDDICRQVLAKIAGDQELQKFLDSVGARETQFPFNRLTTSFAAIDSLMLARKDLASNPSSEDARLRLDTAKRVFRYSFFMFSDEEFAVEAEKQAQGILMMLSGKPRPASLYDERAKQADASLPNWMSADIRKHAFIA
jgi:hypothetical protein